MNCSAQSDQAVWPCVLAIKKSIHKTHEDEKIVRYTRTAIADRKNESICIWYSTGSAAMQS